MKGVVLADEEWSKILDVLYEDSQQEHDASYTVCPSCSSYEVWQKLKAILQSQSDMSIDLFLTDAQHAVVQVKPVNVMGNPAPQTGVPTFTVTTPGIVTLGPSADGSSVDVIAVAGATGGTTVVVTGVSATGKNFSASFNVAVQSAAVANEAVSFDFVFGTPVSK